MLTNDIGVFFGSMTTIYGHLWSHGADEIETWRKAMMANNVTPRDLSIAASRCLKDYPGRPPTMGQVIGLVKAERPLPVTRQIERKPFSLVVAQANRIMLSLLAHAEGVQTDTLKAMIAAKNAVAIDAENSGQDPVEFAAELDTMLRGLIHGHEERTV